MGFVVKTRKVEPLPKKEKERKRLNKDIDSLLYALSNSMKARDNAQAEILRIEALLSKMKVELDAIEKE